MEVGGKTGRVDSIALEPLLLDFRVKKGDEVRSLATFAVFIAWCVSRL